MKEIKSLDDIIKVLKDKIKNNQLTISEDQKWEREWEDMQKHMDQILYRENAAEEYFRPGVTVKQMIKEIKRYQRDMFNSFILWDIYKTIETYSNNGGPRNDQEWEEWKIKRIMICIMMSEYDSDYDYFLGGSKIVDLMEPIKQYIKDHYE